MSQTGEGLVFFGTADPDAAVYAIDAVTGMEVWRFQTYNPAPIHSTMSAPALTVSPPGNNGFADGVVYFANKYGIMYAVDLTTGTEIWEYNFGAQTGLSPTGALDTAALSGTNLVFGDTGGVWDLNALNGTKLWYHSNGPFGEVDGAPAIIGPNGHQVVVASDLTGSMVVLSLADGSQLYTYQTGAFSVGHPPRWTATSWTSRGTASCTISPPVAAPGRRRPPRSPLQSTSPPSPTPTGRSPSRAPPPQPVRSAPSP